MMVTAWTPYYAFGVFFTPLISEFGWTRAVTSGAFSGSQLTRGLGGIIMGRLNDKIGPRIVLTMCSLLLGFGFLLMYFIHSLWQFYIFYTFLIGVGLSGFFVPLLSTVARWFIRKRGTMSGIVNTSVGLATLVGAPLATLLLSVYDWRFSFVIISLSIMIIIPISAQFLKREPREIGQLPDGEKKELEQEMKGPVGLTLEEAVRKRQFWLFFLATMSFGYVNSTTLVHIVPHALVLNIPPVEAAGILSAMGALSVVGRLILGNAADKLGDRKIYLLGFTIMVISFSWLIILRQTWMLYLFAAVFGLAQGGMGAVGSPFVAELFGLKSHGSIFGVANVGHTIGAALGPFVSGFIFDITGSYQEAFITCIAISIIGLIVTWLIRGPALTPNKFLETK